MSRPLTVVLALLAAGNLFGLWLGLSDRAGLLAEFPKLETVWPVYLACPVASLVAIAALWSGRRWGYWLALAVGLVVFALETWASGLAPHTFRVPMAMALLTMVTRPVWRSLR